MTADTGYHWMDESGALHVEGCDGTEECPDCHGSAVANSDGDICGECGGAGTVDCTGCA